MKRATLLLLISMITGISFGQTITTVTSGLLSPAGICKDMSGHLIVAEAGTGNNDGRVSMIDSTGARWTLVHGLPSAMDTATGEISGPWRPYMMPDSILLVITGGGPDTLGGVDSVAGSILLFDFTGFVAGTDSFDVNDAVKIIDIQSWVLNNGFIDSNPFSAYFDIGSGNLYVVDAGANAVLKIDSTATISVLDTFPQISNPTPAPPPVIDYVPTDIVSDSMGTLYMCNLTGFPFIPGLASVVTVDSSGFSHTTHASGLTLCVDMEMDSQLYVLQYGRFDTSTFMPIPGSACLMVVHSNGMIDTVVTGFGVSAGFTTDWSGGYYATEIMNGTLVHITDINTAVPMINKQVTSLSAYPNPFTKALKVNYSLARKSDVSITLTDLNGKAVFSRFIGSENEGNHSIQLDVKETEMDQLSSGKYILTVSGDNSRQSIVIVKQ